MNSYAQLLSDKKEDKIKRHSITANPHKNGKPHQKECLKHLLSMGRGAAFLDTGLGKTFLQCDWARHIPGPVLLVAPLAVAQQTVKEAKKLLDMDITYSKDGSVTSKYTITNYERIDLFDCDQFEGVVLDESSILKGQNSKTKANLCELFQDTKYKLACTATPAPNDYTELGNHAEFLGIMNTQEMLTRWFVHDSANTADWRLKKHAVKDFWQWVSSWAACVSMPSDLGFPDNDYILPPLSTETHIFKSNLKSADGMLFDIATNSATDLHKTKRETMETRCMSVADMVNNNNRPWIVWCESNDESTKLSTLIPDAVEVKGSHTPEQKEQRLVEFSSGKARVIISKSSICGFGMNWQHCRDIAFASISYSYEKYYQAVRRSWRFGQDQPVRVHAFMSDSEQSVWKSIQDKMEKHQAMKSHMKYAVFSLGQEKEVKVDYTPNHESSLPPFLTPQNRNN